MVITVSPMVPEVDIGSPQEECRDCGRDADEEADDDGDEEPGKRVEQVAGQHADQPAQNDVTEGSHATATPAMLPSHFSSTRRSLSDTVPLMAMTG